MSDNQTLLLGAVAYDPKAVSIWDGFQRYFCGHGLAFDYILYSNYERQVEAHFAGQIHVAWNSPLAWLQSQRVAALTGRRAEAIAMRDTDRDLRSVIVARAGGPVRGIAGLRGKRVAAGAADSPQAYLIPLDLIAREGLVAGRDFELEAFDRLLGKHGDHTGGERDAARALMEGRADAACMIEANYLGFTREGLLTRDSTRIVAQTEPYDHCNFTVLDGAPAKLIARFRELLLGMEYTDPEVRPLFEMEGLKQWLPGRASGYAALDAALDRFGAADRFVRSVAARVS